MAEYSKYSRGPGDSILALLEPGEYVLNRNAVNDIGEEKLDEINFEDSPRFDMSQRSNFQVGGMLGDMMGYQEGGNKGLEYAEEYEYSPTSIQKLLDKLPGLGGKRAYDRARDYQKAVHLDPEMRESRRKMMEEGGVNVTGKNIRNIMSDFGKTKQNEWKSKKLVKSLEDPRNFGFRTVLANDDITDVNQYIAGLDTGHTVTEDGRMRYSVDPHNIAKTNPGKDILGLIPFGYSGSVKENPGIDPYIDPESLMGQITGMQAGGSTLSYGGATSETQSLDDIYRRMGMQPNLQQREQFEEQYAYDPTREGVIFEDYGRAIQGATQSGRQNLMGAGQQMQQAQAKSGFAGGGAGQQAQTQARDTIMKDFLAQEGAAKSSLFKQVRGERESWMSDVGAGLSQLQSAEGTEMYGGDNSERGDINESYVDPSDTSDRQSGDDLHSEQTEAEFNPNVFTTESVTVDGVTWQWNPAIGSYQQAPGGFSDKHLKENINLIGSSDSGVNIYTFEYKDKSYGDGLYKGVMAQEVPWASIMMNNGYLAVDYNKIDVDFKRIF
jgi:hypothetical protein